MTVLNIILRIVMAIILIAYAWLTPGQQFAELGIALILLHMDDPALRDKDDE